MNIKEKVIAIIFALFAAGFYALSNPISKLLLVKIDPIMLAGLLYLGAGLGIGFIFLFIHKQKEKLIRAKDLPYTIGMIVLDVIAPILLMIGLTQIDSSNASLLNNFEIVATSLIAMIIFKEFISLRLWIAILIITISSCILSFNDITKLEFSFGSILVIFATICWGFENNFTKKLSDRDVYEVVTIKRLCCGLITCCISYFNGVNIPSLQLILISLLVGFVAYGLSILLYIKAQNKIGAAKTSSFYSIAPFISVILSFFIFGIHTNITFWISLILMIIGTSIVTIDTIKK